MSDRFAILESPALLPPCFASADTWFVLHTRSRQEKVVSEELSAREVGHFLPLIERVRFYGKRKAVVQEPLFPGYVFMRGSIEQAYPVDRNNRIASVIRVPDQGRLEWELRNLAIAISSRAPMDPYPYLKCGMRVEVNSGPLRGVQGVVERRNGSCRLILQVDILGQAVALEIDGTQLDPLD